MLGDGRQRKSYVLADDVIAGMSWISAHGSSDDAVQVFNLAAGDSLDVAEVADAVAAAMGLPSPHIVTTTNELSWAGDQPIIELGIQRALSTGWQPTVTARRAVEIAASRLLTVLPQVST